MSTPLAAASGHGPGTSDKSWLWIIVGFAIFVVAGIILYVTKSSEVDFNWVGLVFLAVAALLMWTAASLILSSDSAEGELGGGHMVLALILMAFGSVMIFTVFLPPSVMKTLQKGAFLYASKPLPKPHIAEIITPDPLPAITWISVELPVGPALPTGATAPPPRPVFIQIEMTEVEAKAGLPVLQDITKKRGKIVGWYGIDKTESKTDDF